MNHTNEVNVLCQDFLCPSVCVALCAILIYLVILISLLLYLSLVCKVVERELLRDFIHKGQYSINEQYYSDCENKCMVVTKIPPDDIIKACLHYGKCLWKLSNNRTESQSILASATLVVSVLFLNLSLVSHPGLCKC